LEVTMSTTIFTPIRFHSLHDAAYFHQYLRWAAELREEPPQRSHPQFRGLSARRAGQIEEYAEDLIDAIRTVG
jgi:hypothetical protein